MAKQNKPAIRFKGFTDAWEQRKLGDTNTYFTDGNYGEAYPKPSDMTDSSEGVPFLTGSNLKGGRLDITGVSYITKEKHEKLTSGHLIEDDIVIAVRGSLGALGYVNKENSGWNINSQLAILRTDKTELSGKYMLQFLLSGNGQIELLKRQTGSALKQLPINAIKDVDIPITSIEEQSKIGQYFVNLDSLITLHQRKYDKLQVLKKAMLEKMFPKNGSSVPEIRFKGFTDAWEQRKLSDLYTPLVERNSDLLPYNKTLSVATMTYKTDGNGAADSSLANYKRLRTGDIAFEGHTSKSFRYGRFVLNDVGDGIMSPRFSALRPLAQMPTNFWKYYIHYEPIMRKILVASTKAGTMMNELVIDEFLKSSVLVPSIEEQTRIGSILKNIDHLITLHQRELEKLQNIKKSMLEKMFV
ncbi:MAG: restriction endonuclease subunit S [Gemmiger sp.]|uniref:restriction endonuclease subunit S n=1 Tax=Gemmiger sp. TaxID=2049027 RepID=UPI002A90CA1B|nr:restriction endonuclease subunit S [Gemmiger sp.]MDY5204239.1 restriction endonuclease subunit S [Gemmiger sp.]